MTNKTDKIHIFFSSDDNYAQHLGVSIASILCNADKNDEFCFYIIDGGISEKNRKKIQNLNKIRSFKLEFLNINEDDFKDCSAILQGSNHQTIPAFYRFKIASLKPELSKALYLDCDVIVQKSLKALWDTDVSDYLFGVVEEPAYDGIKKQVMEKLNCEHYFNSGVLLINLDKWREVNAEKACFDYASKEKCKLIWIDQDILNALFKNSVKFLHPKWNFEFNLHTAYCGRGGFCSLYSAEEISEAAQNPGIIHYTTDKKPWNPRKKHPYEKEYFKYLKITGWKKFIYKYKFLRLKALINLLAKR